MAKLVSDEGDAYLPIFQRIHNEIQQQKELQHLKEIASMMLSTTR